MWCLPTLSRPKQCAEVLARIKQVGCSTPGIVFVNGEAHAKEYLVELAGNMPDGWRIRVHPENIGCIAALNLMFKENQDAKWFGFIGDDEMLAEDVPSDWDKRLIDTAGNWKIAHGHEDWNDGRRCQGYPVWGHKLLRTVGYWALPDCFHNFGLDSHYDWLNGARPFGGGNLHNIVCLPEIKITHNRAKPDVTMDECYKIADEAMEADRRIFWEWIKNDMPKTAMRIMNAMANDIIERVDESGVLHLKLPRFEQEEIGRIEHRAKLLAWDQMMKGIYGL